MKCDRQRPCGTCSKRGIALACKYAATTPSSSLGRRQSTPPRPSSLSDRIGELESLVVTLIQKQSSKGLRHQAVDAPEPTAGIDLFSRKRNLDNAERYPETPSDPGSLTFDDSKSSYSTSAHWEAVLSKVKGLKEDLTTRSDTTGGNVLLYGTNRGATREEMIAAIPPRPIADRLLGHHFNSLDAIACTLHRSTRLEEQSADTQRQSSYTLASFSERSVLPAKARPWRLTTNKYESFWQNPMAAPIAWVGLLFAMLCLGAQLQQFQVDSDAEASAGLLASETEAAVNSYREKTVQCLLLARYTHGGPYVLEALILYLASEFTLLKDSTSDAWFIGCMLVHLAMRMGYHRDPDHFPGISPFAGEMRRRVWATVFQIDLLMSSESGLPRTTGIHIDTKEPRNISETDFDEDSTELPPSRPETEMTTTLYLIARTRISSVLGLISDINADTRVPSYDEIMSIDKAIEDAHNGIPDALKWGESQSILDSPNTLLRRQYLEMTYLRARILLHRRSLIDNSTYTGQGGEDESLRIALDAALKILEFQELIDDEIQAGGRLYPIRWKISHLVSHDMLLATSMLCRYLQRTDNVDHSDASEHHDQTARRDEVRQRLATSQRIWLTESGTSTEAQKVARALSIVLQSAGTAATENSGAAIQDYFTGVEAMPFNIYDASTTNQCE